MTVKEDEGIGSRIGRDLVPHEGVIAVKVLPVSGRVIGIVGGFGRNDGAASGEAPLLFDGERCGRKGSGKEQGGE